MTGVRSAPDSIGTEEFGRAARAIAPLLNRVVFTGRAIAPLLFTNHAFGGPPAAFTSDKTFRVLSSVSPDRLAVDLRQLGLVRGRRTGRSELWSASSGTALEFVHVSGDEGDSASIWTEYASLLTIAVDPEPGLRVRITGAPALLALDWYAFCATARSPLDSGELEDIIALVAGRAEVVREVAAAPPELRAFVAGETRRFLEMNCAEHLIRRTLPAAAQLPALVARVVERLGRIAG